MTVVIVYETHAVLKRIKRIRGFVGVHWVIPLDFYNVPGYGLHEAKQTTTYVRRS